MKKKIGIVTDSSTGLTIKDFETMKDIGFCPLLIIFNNNEIEDNPKNLNQKDFIKKIKTEKEIPSTTQTPIGLTTNIWEAMLEKFEKIIFIPISKGLSGQYSTASMLAKEPNFKNKVYVFDSRGVSVINYVLVKKAYEMSQNENNNVTTILNALTKIRDNHKTFILPNDMKYLAKGGRISTAAAGLATFLKIKPILSFDFDSKGTIDKLYTTRTWKKALKIVFNEILKWNQENKKHLLYVVHSIDDSNEMSKKLLAETEKFIKSYNFQNIQYAKLANVIIAHTGLDTFAIVSFNVDINEIK